MFAESVLGPTLHQTQNARVIVGSLSLETLKTKKANPIRTILNFYDVVSDCLTPSPECVSAKIRHQGMVQAGDSTNQCLDRLASCLGVQKSGRGYCCGADWISLDDQKYNIDQHSQQ